MTQTPHHQVMDRVKTRLDQAARVPAERPFVTLSYAQSLDGSITTRPGATLGLSNSASQALTHDIRAHHEAILVGVNTVLTDDPRLTVRLVDGRSPRPVIVDSHLKTPPTARLLA